MNAPKTDGASKTNGAPQGAQDQPPAPPPMFYTRPVPVSPDTLGNFKMRGEMDFSFAAKTNIIPVTVPEFVLAARHYPIVFVGDELVPSVAVGLRPDDNLFVNVKGEWEIGQYIPAYVRRYPFILLGAASDERLHLGVDETAFSSKPDARALFDGTKEPEIVKQALNMCEQFHGAFRYTADFSKALVDTKITEVRSLDVDAAGGGVQSLGSFVAISEDKFKELPDEIILDWRKKGWLHAVYFHLQSVNNWEFLLGRASSRMAVASAIA